MIKWPDWFFEASYGPGMPMYVNEGYTWVKCLPWCFGNFLNVQFHFLIVRSFIIISPGEDFCVNRLSSCRACYYGATERKAPKNCKRFVRRKSARTPAKAEKRVKKWGKCVKGVYDEVCSIKFGSIVVINSKCKMLHLQQL